MRRALVQVAAFAVACTCLARDVAPAGAQGQKPPTFRATTDIVQTDVTVLGPDGRPMRGLTMADFELYEDGERLELLGFAEVSIPDADDGPAWLRDSSADVRNALGGRVFVFLLDDAQVPYLMTRGRGFIHPNERIAAVTRIAEQFINRMGPDDAAAVICVFDKRCDQDFTSDRGRLRAAVGKFMPKSIPPGYGASPYKVSANMTMSIARMLDGQASRRRTIIYISPSLPTRPEIWPPPASKGMSLEDIQVLATFKSAMSSGITVYGVNPTLLLSLKDALPADPDAPESEQALKYSAPPRSLSLETGGFNISRPDQFAEGVTQIFRETGSYYLLGYEPPPKKDTGYNMIGGLRSLEVRVNRPGAVVKARRGYIAPPPRAAPKNPPAAATSALAGVLPKTDLPLRVNVVPFALPGERDSLVVVTVAINQPPTDSRIRDQIDVQIRAFTPHGDERAMKRMQIDPMLAPSRDGAAVTEVVAELRLKPGVYAIRASAYSERMGTAGSVFADVEIPDVAKAPLALSGILLMAVPRPESVTPEPLSQMLPAVPTTRREFTRTAVVRAHVRVYQGDRAAAAPVTIRTTILDGTGAAVLDRTESLAADRFGTTRSADVRIDVPVGALGVGAHRLRIEATAAGAPVHRDVQFVMK